MLRIGGICVRLAPGRLKRPENTISSSTWDLRGTCLFVWLAWQYIARSLEHEHPILRLSASAGREEGSLRASENDVPGSREHDLCRHACLLDLLDHDYLCLLYVDDDRHHSGVHAFPHHDHHPYCHVHTDHHGHVAHHLSCYSVHGLCPYGHSHLAPCHHAWTNDDGLHGSRVQLWKQKKMNKDA